MAVIKSIEELEKIRDQAKDLINLRKDNETKTRVVVGMGTCGIAAGARQAMLAILDEIKKRNLDNVIVTETGCIGLCKFEPLVDVIKPNQPKVTYVNVNEEKARQIVVKHIINNQVIDDWVIPNI
ncbi:MAG: NADP-reducing hydrogenase subunit HndB [Thermoanaerobacteraceae bacterium]|jgi:NADP-reducing hydrogenase subunit HndB|uniref:(2Fe-2S) ferredoxin domain-containing protein n=1 Tax=Biomaibacter acetigenes TaxID=2316383 RepID=A0A3G2R6F9_9FIRM|nr:(2Fe-2S) ferredoxin domain-containing protein [Biomaibacter acetigenes]AYO31032.1 (2Fe-2S) ferredoxin domain-containing protein [Biomaibacter acetigenes]MDK2877324.1 NADP-reducing hydrogenase subunit HndB [Thermoanaerobacteraceae bacterium]MDN5301979.1 NADP-reducing hydrogenase subunit HndB [Thermoanaerobacteraceae bacterium]RKL63894.1 (2Fe-2S) ferredoxin domain-containing protein [Thermoanaerobacteraceae bacterium SP2]